MQVTKEGSVRVDLVGGTLDLEPINLILPNVVTLNVATSLKAKVVLESCDFDGVEIVSSDYGKTYKFQSSDFSLENLYSGVLFKEMKFVCQILDLFEARKNLKVTLSSGAPAGSGLGGSSAMGVTLYSALCEFFNRPFNLYEAVQKVKGTEGRILNQGVPGYQDYFPALTGGILAIRGKAGELEYEQLYTEELKEYLESHMTLVYSGLSRDSGINNWDVYKAFFDKDPSIREAMSNIAEISHDTYKSILDKDYERVLELIGEEGKARVGLAANIAPSEILELKESLEKQFGPLGLKMCGAGGGGCFILTHSPDSKTRLKEEISKLGMEVLDFCIDRPLQ